MKTARFGIILWAAGVIILLGSCATIDFPLLYRTGLDQDEEVIGSVEVEYVDSQPLRKGNEERIQSKAYNELKGAFQSQIARSSKAWQSGIGGISDVKNISIFNNGRKLTARGDVIVAVPPDPPPVPLTAAILRRLEEHYGSLKENINNIQLFLGGSVQLEREIRVLGDTIQSDGRIIFQNMSTTETVNFRNRTEGQAVAIFEPFDDYIVLHVGFERENAYRLSFDCDARDDPDAMFFLEYNFIESEDLPTPSDVKGIWVYDGNNEYTVKHPGDKPYLLIDLSQIENPNTNSRTASGRRVPLP